MRNGEMSSRERSRDSRRALDPREIAEVACAVAQGLRGDAHAVEQRDEEGERGKAPGIARKVCIMR